MAQFRLPSSPSVYHYNLTNFLGVDFTSVDIDPQRASDMKNLINNNGFLETRPGYAQIGTTIGNVNINGVWNIDKPNDIFLIHAGTNLYSVDNTFTTWTLLKSDLPDKITHGYYIGDYFIIVTGVKLLVYGYFDNIYQVKNADSIGYIPTITINRNPDGTGGITNEDVNDIQPVRIVSFLGTATDINYHLPEKNCDSTAPTATVLNSNGTYTALSINNWDYTNGIVTFTTTPGVSPVDGRDNVFIRYSKTNSESISHINKSTIGDLYGYNGNKNRLFLAGNSDFSNIVWYSKDDNPLYWPSNNYIKVGVSPIINFINLNDGTLGIQKNVTDSDFTIYYIKGIIFNNLEAFEVNDGSYNIGCIAENANDNLLNDPLTLSEKGVYGITTSSYGERFANERSYYIKKKLLKEANLEKAFAIVNGNKYYLLINNHMYVADSRYQSKVSQANTGSYSYQYEWYYWDNIPARILFNYNNELYFGTTDGKIVKFNDTCLDYDVPINCRFETAFLNLNSLTRAKTIKTVTVICKPDVDSEYTLGYTTDEGDSDIITKTYSTINYPRTLQEKEKISKFMFIKFYLENNSSKKMSFYAMSFEYVYSGNYRGN